MEMTSEIRRPKIQNVKICIEKKVVVQKYFFRYKEVYFAYACQKQGEERFSEHATQV